MEFLLEIQIPTITDRYAQFNILKKRILKLIAPYPNVILTSCSDNRQLTIGEKRQLLYNKAIAEYVVQIDDDDDISDYYIDEALNALKKKPDCVGYLEELNLSNNKNIACHSNRFKNWEEKNPDYLFCRTIFYKDIIKTTIAKKIPFHFINYGEDNQFSKDLKKSGLLKKEIFIDKIMYIYKK